MKAGFQDTPPPAPHTEDWRSTEAVDGSNTLLDNTMAGQEGGYGWSELPRQDFGFCGQR